MSRKRKSEGGGFDADYARRAERFSDGEQWRSIVSRVLEMMRVELGWNTRGGRLADVGCNTGKLMAEATRVRPGLICEGYDVNEDAIRFASAMDLPYCKFTTYDGVKLPCASSRYDVITCCFVLSHCQHPLSVLSEMCRALKDTGVVYLVVPNMSFDKLMVPWNVVTGYVPDQTIEHHWSVDKLSEMARMCGFDDVTVEYVGEKLKWSLVDIAKFRAYVLLELRK